MSSGRWRISVTTPDWGHDHLSSDAVVAYVDDELAPGPQLRATEHLAQCRECAAQVVAQGQARAALRTADCPSLPTSLLSSLRSIPQDTELPAPPVGLSVTSEGQFVSMLRPEQPAPEQADGAAPEQQRRSHRGRRFGTGVAMSGLAIGAIAFAMPGATGESSTAEPDADGRRGHPAVGGAVGPVSPVDARLNLHPAPQAGVSGPAASSTTSAPASAPTTASTSTPASGAAAPSTALPPGAEPPDPGTGTFPGRS